MTDINDIKSLKIGDIIELSDYHTLDAIGDKVSVGITETRHLRNDQLDYYQFELSIDDDTTLMLVVREIGDTCDYRVFRLWEQSTQKNIDTRCFEDVGDGFDFCNFKEYTDGEDSEDGICEYIIKEPYPFWNLEVDEDEVSICEYILNEEEDDFWAKNGLVEWYFHNDEDGLVSVWFGWDITENEINTLKQ